MFGLWVSLVAACGGSDGQQMCGADHCGLQGHTVVKWTFDAYPEWMFPNDSCPDFSVLKVRVDAQAADASIVTKIDDCGVSQVTFDGLAEGEPYTMFVDPEDGLGNSLVMYPTTVMVNAGAYQADTSVSANVPWDSWVGSFTGTFLFRLSWATQGCAAAGVVTQNVTLSVNGTPVSAVADNGQKLVRPLLNVSFKGPAGYRRTLTRKLDTILPGDTIAYPYVWPDDLAAGDYRVTVVATNGSERETVTALLHLGTKLRGTHKQVIARASSVPYPLSPAALILIALAFLTGSLFIGFRFGSRREARRVS